MSFGELFIVRARRKAEKGAAYAAAATTGEATGVFITPKSLTTFPMASFVVTLFWLLAKTVFPTWGAAVWVPVVISLIVGVIIFVATTAEQDLKPRSGRQWFLAVAVAFVNSMYLAASALGLLRQLAK